MKCRMSVQQELVFDYMREFGSITQSEGVYRLGISDTRKRISELTRLFKDEGMPFEIRKEKEYGEDRRGKQTSWTRYFLEEIWPA